MSDIIANVIPNLQSAGWVIVLLLAIIIEGATQSLATIWFIGGSFVASIVAAMGFDFMTQLWVFALVSAVLLILTRPLYKKISSKSKVPTNYDMIIGQKLRVVEDIDNNSSTGAVYAMGKVWTARLRDSNNDRVIIKNSFVKAVDIKGVKIIVEELEE